MMKNRYLLCLLLCGWMLYYGLSRLPIHTTGVEYYFSILWIVLCVFAIAGNLAAILYSPKSKKRSYVYTSSNQRKKTQKARSFS